MEATCGRAQTHHKVRTVVAAPGLCSVLAKEACLVAKFRTTALPDDFVPGYSVQDTLEKIREQHSNYDELLEELQSTCVDRVIAGNKCPFSRHLALGTARHRCPFLGLLCSTLTSLADEWAEGAFSIWRWRKMSQRSTHRRVFQRPHPREGVESTGRASAHGQPLH